MQWIRVTKRLDRDSKESQKRLKRVSKETRRKSWWRLEGVAKGKSHHSAFNITYYLFFLNNKLSKSSIFSLDETILQIIDGVLMVLFSSILYFAAPPPFTMYFLFFFRPTRLKFKVQRAYIPIQVGISKQCFWGMKNEDILTFILRIKFTEYTFARSKSKDWKTVFSLQT